MRQFHRARMVAVTVCVLLLNACTQSHRTAVYGTVDATPYFSSGADSATQLAGVTSAFRLPSGQIVVADSASELVARIDTASGAMISIGRKGDGPGEYRRVEWAEQCNVDSIFVWDASHDVISVFDADGKLAREFRPAPLPWRIQCSAGTNHLFYVHAPQLTGEAVSTKTYSAPVTIANLAGDSVAAIPSIQLGENRALGHLTQLAVAGKILYVGTSDSFSVDRYAMDGARAGAVPIVGTLRPPADSDYERELVTIMLSMGRDTTRTAPVYRRLFGSVPRPKLLPAYRALLVSPAGELWAEVSRPGQAVQVWRVTSGTGVPLGDLPMPAGFRLMEVGKDYLLGALDDAGGEEHVALYHFNRSSAQ